MLAGKKGKTSLPTEKTLLVEKERWETLKDDCEGNPYQQFCGCLTSSFFRDSGFPWFWIIQAFPLHATKFQKSDPMYENAKFICTHDCMKVKSWVIHWIFDT